jgi:hypothetical protein
MHSSDELGRPGREFVPAALPKVPTPANVSSKQTGFINLVEQEWPRRRNDSPVAETHRRQGLKQPTMRPEKNVFRM